MIEFILATFLILSIGLNIFLAVICYRYAKYLFGYQDSIQDALDKIDESYRKIYEISTRYVFADNLEVREVIKEINNIRDVVLYVATKMSGQNEEKKEK